jgi:hypothetical protein
VSVDRKSLVGWSGVVLICAPALAQAAERGGLLAYLDPGAGSFILQALVAALAGIIVTVNVYWRRIKRFFSRGPAAGDDPPNREAADE